MQLNQLGAPEVILESTQANQLETQSNSSFTTVQIWDVDSKMQMFNGTKKWYSEIELLSKTKLDNNTDYTFNLGQLRPSLIVLVSSCIGINHCKFIKWLWAI